MIRRPLWGGFSLAGLEYRARVCYNKEKIYKERAMALHVLDEANRCLQCKDPQCIKGCPIKTPIPDIIRLLKESKLDEAGKICLDRADLVDYSHGTYYTLGDPLGNFGFSAVKRRPHHKK